MMKLCQLFLLLNGVVDALYTVLEGNERIVGQHIGLKHLFRVETH